MINYAKSIFAVAALGFGVTACGNNDVARFPAPPIVVGATTAPSAMSRTAPATSTHRGARRQPHQREALTGVCDYRQHRLLG